MLTTSVTSKGQVTLPKNIRQQLGIRKGSKLQAVLVEGHIELYVKNTVAIVPSSGFAMLKSKRAAVPVDFDSASLLKK